MLIIQIALGYVLGRLLLEFLSTEVGARVTFTIFGMLLFLVPILYFSTNPILNADVMELISKFLR